MDVFLFLHENICCGYSLEAPRRGASNEYHKICFHGEIRKIFIWISHLSWGMTSHKTPTNMFSKLWRVTKNRVHNQPIFVPWNCCVNYFRHEAWENEKFEHRYIGNQDVDIKPFKFPEIRSCHLVWLKAYVRIYLLVFVMSALSVHEME